MGQLMTDPHLRILTAAARHSQSKLDAHDLARDPADVGSTARRRDLSERLQRTRAQLAAARTRRGFAPHRPRTSDSE